jgi:hypothetical protein
LLALFDVVLLWQTSDEVRRRESDHHGRAGIATEGSADPFARIVLLAACPLPFAGLHVLSSTPEFDIHYRQSRVTKQKVSQRWGCAKLPVRR